MQRRGETGRSSAIPLGSLPVLTLASGVVVVESAAIARYAAKLAKLYPIEPLQALFVDEILEVVADVVNGLPQNPDVDTKKKLREDYAAGKLNSYYSFLAEKLEANGGSFFVGSEFSVADIAVYGVLKGLRSGNFDFIAATYDEKWPVFQGFLDTIEANPVFAPYKL